jgi:hypothetical protein
MKEIIDRFGVRNNKFWEEIIHLLPLHYLVTDWMVNKDMALHKITELFTELFSAYPNMTSKFR